MDKYRARVRLVAPLALAALAAVACAKTTTSTATNKGGTTSVTQGGQIVATIEKDIQDFNVLTANGNTFDTTQVTNGIYPVVFNVDPQLNVFLNKDLMVSADLTSNAPETVVYKIQPNAKWSDGVAINVDDFTYAWQTENGKNPNYTPASTTGYDSIASVTGSDNGKTVTVVFDKKFADWKSLFGTLLPAHYMKTLNADPVKAYNSGLLAPKFPTISGGPFLLTEFKSNDHATLIRNPNYYGKAAHLDKIIFRIITDSTQEPIALQNNEVQYIYPQPQVDLIKQVRAISGVTDDVGFGLIFEHFDFNLANPALKNIALRRALFTAVDRTAIVGATVKQFSDKSTVLNSRMLLPGQPGYADNSDGLGQGNVTAAKQLLTTAGYTGVGTKLVGPDGKAIPALRFRYTTGNTIREHEGELFKAAAAALGVTVNIISTDKLGGTLSKGDFDVIVFAWVGTPFPFSSNEAIYVTKGDSNFDGYSNSVVDGALKDAATQLDQAKATADLNTADLQLSKDAVTLPLYQKATYLAYYSKYGNINNNSTSVGPTYNIGDWGVKKAS